MNKEGGSVGIVTRTAAPRSGAMGVSQGPEGISKSMSISREGHITAPSRTYPDIQPKMGGQRMPDMHPRRDTIDIRSMYTRRETVTPTIQNEAMPKPKTERFGIPVRPSPASLDTQRRESIKDTVPVAQSRESLIKVHPVKTPESVAQRGRSSESNSHTQQPIETTARSNKAQLRARVEQLRKSTTTSNEDQPKAHELTPEKVVQSPAISKVGEREPADKKQASRRAVEDLKRDYVESYIMPHVTEQKKIADRAEQGTDRPQTVQAPSTKPENLVLSADIAAQAFNADIERALRVQELAQALKDKAPTQTEWANIDPKSLALQSIDYSLQRTAVKKAVITAVEIGEEQDNPDVKASPDAQSEAQSEGVATPTTETQHTQVLDVHTEEAPASTSDQVVTTASTEAQVLLTEEMLEEQNAVAEKRAPQIDPSIVITPSGEVLVEEETVGFTYQLDERANENRRAYAYLAAQTVFDAKAHHEELIIKGREITSLMPSSIDQPEDIQSELVKGVQLQDGSYNQMIADINGITVYDFSQIEPQIDTAIENNSAVKEVEIHQMTMRPATDEERKKVLDDSTRYYQEAA